jgi:acyl-CoA synthetase (AMP-forming)/AMP-acid ligase II
MSATVFEIVAAHAARRPDASALSGAGMHWSYREMVDAAERLACGLAARGVTRGKTFAIVADNHPTTALAWLAGQRCGAIPSNCNALLRERELAWILGNLTPELVITDAQHVEIVRAALADAGHAAEIVLNVRGDDFPELSTLDDLQQSAPYEGPLPGPDDPFEITYTSGTTSNPKGVVLTHRAVLHRAAAQQRQFGLDESDTALVGTPLFHQSGSRDCVLLIWHAGGHAAIMPKFTASGYWKHAMAVGATYTCMVETMALLLERQPEGEHDRSHGIKVVMSGAPAPLRLRAEARFGFKMVGGYGMTECGFPVAIPREQGREELQHYLSFRPGANFAGWPVEENEVRIVDPEGCDVAEGETGEIRIRSGGLLREYWRDAEATAASLQDGWLHTGDSGMRGPQGSVYFVDRIKDMIRRGGENVAPKEIEDIIHGHPDVAQAVAYPVPDPLYIQEAKVIVITKPGRELTAQAIWEWCEPRMAKYKVPRYVEFRDSVPTSGSGRAQKSELRQEPIVGLGGTFDRTTAGLVQS